MFYTLVLIKALYIRKAYPYITQVVLPTSIQELIEVSMLHVSTSTRRP